MQLSELTEGLKDYLETRTPDERWEAVSVLRRLLHAHSPQSGQPIDHVLWVPLESVVANDYNPNSVAKVELRLLYTSIDHDGYTQPCVTIRDDDNDCWVIVDGFHRYFTMKTNRDIYDRCHGLLPIVVLNKGINDRMASTVRHNRARGKHSVAGMSAMVFSMLENGWADHDICNELGMSAEELLRLKHITGFSKLFKDHEYQKSWLTKRQIEIKAEIQAEEAQTAEHKETLPPPSPRPKRVAEKKRAGGDSMADFFLS